MSGQPKRHLLDETAETLPAWFAEVGEPSFRATQVFEWVYRHGAVDFDTMSNLSRGLRTRLAETFDIYTSTVLGRFPAGDGTLKLLLRWPDSATTECVMIPDDPRRTACVSSQVGCPVGCRFCASGLDGVERNLTPGQIVEQWLRLEQALTEDEKDAGARRRRLTNIVFMGSGEPLANYRNVLAAVRIFNAQWGPHVGARRITISTVGLPKQIRQLADEELQVNLALSLHAPTDRLRRELIPWADAMTLADLLDACRHYFEKTGREITLEYVLLAGVNDRPEHSEALAAIAHRLRCNVNLLRYNPVQGLEYRRPTAQAAHDFQKALRRRGVNVHVRRSRGLDVDAACGQLRRRLAAQAAAPLIP
jgi:23S rRNA (adenine2503-C2)-methyltransferase